MKEQIIRLFNDHAQAAFLISIAISILIAVLGIVPSFFVTAANILFFGFWRGILVSFIGEAVGAVVAFVLYRKGFKKPAAAKLDRFPKLQVLLNAKSREAFFLILYLRLIPFVPSGLVTFTAAVGKISLTTFVIASSLGKIPALMLEGYSSYQLTEFGWQGKIILTIAALFLLYFTIKQISRQKNQ